MMEIWLQYRCIIRGISFSYSFSIITSLQNASCRFTVCHMSTKISHPDHPAIWLKQLIDWMKDQTLWKRKRLVSVCQNFKSSQFYESFQILLWSHLTELCIKCLRGKWTPFFQPYYTWPDLQSYVISALTFLHMVIIYSIKHESIFKNQWPPINCFSSYIYLSKSLKLIARTKMV